MKNPGVGVGVIIENSNGHILIGKRKGSIAPYFSIPGGKLDLGESFEEAAIREIQEETGLLITAPKVVSITNNLATFKEEGIHYISIILHCNSFQGEPRLMEPDRCEGWLWVDPRELPVPHFEASKIGVQCFLEEVFYLKDKASKA